MDLKQRIQAMPQIFTASQMIVSVVSPDIPDEMALDMTSMFPVWAPDTAYQADRIIQHDGELYRIAQNHTSQAQWVPGATGTESLYTHISIDPETGYEEWQQPLGAHDAYSESDIVLHNGKTWISIVPGEHTNVWEPGVYGWNEYTA